MAPAVVVASLSVVGVSEAAVPAEAGPERLVAADGSIVEIAAERGVLAWLRQGVDGRPRLAARVHGLVRTPAVSPGLTDLDATRDDRGRVFLTYLRCGTKLDGSRDSCAPYLYSFTTGERRARGLPRGSCAQLRRWRAWRDSAAAFYPSQPAPGCRRAVLMIRARSGTRRLRAPTLRGYKASWTTSTDLRGLADLRGDRFSVLLGRGVQRLVWIGRVSRVRDSVVYAQEASEGECDSANSEPVLTDRWAYWTVTTRCNSPGPVERHALVRVPTRRDPDCIGHSQSLSLAGGGGSPALDGTTIYYTASDGIRQLLAPRFGPVSCHPAPQPVT